MNDGDAEGTSAIHVPYEQADSDRPRFTVEHVEKLKPSKNENRDGSGKGLDELLREDRGESWQDSRSGLLPGTIFAIILALAAVALFFWVPTLGLIVGVVAAANAVIAVRLWLQLGERRT